MAFSRTHLSLAYLLTHLLYVENVNCLFQDAFITYLLTYLLTYSVTREFVHQRKTVVSDYSPQQDDG